MRIWLISSTGRWPLFFAGDAFVSVFGAGCLSDGILTVIVRVVTVGLFLVVLGFFKGVGESERTTL